MPRRPRGSTLPFGPITLRVAKIRRIVYGPLSALQFDDLERMLMLERASASDLRCGRVSRSESSCERILRRYHEEGWVERVMPTPGYDSCETMWRLTTRGHHVLRAAFDHMDVMVGETGEDG